MREIDVRPNPALVRPHARKFIVHAIMLILLMASLVALRLMIMLIAVVTITTVVLPLLPPWLFTITVSIVDA